MKAPKETRGSKYGKNLAIFVGCVFGVVPESEREAYKKRFLQELRTYSDQKSIRELDGIDKIDINNPEELAKLIKEGLHLMYQRNTSENALDSFLENL